MADRTDERGRDSVAEAADDLEPVAQLIAARSGHRFQRAQYRALEMAVRQRMKDRQIAQRTRYLAAVLESARTDAGPVAEVDELMARYANTETHFFRHMGRFRLLRRHIVPALCRAKSSGGLPLRILSAGCATGEEAYSAAMAMLELKPLWQHAGLEVLGCDMNHQALAVARQGRYRAWTGRFTPAELLGRYFEPRKHGTADLQVSEAVRQWVTFHQANLLDPLLADKLGHSRFDVVFCCNVIMYMTGGAASRTLAQVSGLVAPGGFLMLGYAENFRGSVSDFRAIRDEDYVTYQRAERLAPPATANARPAAPEASPRPRVRPSHRRRGADDEPSAPGPAALAPVRLDGQDQAGYRQALEHCRADRQATALLAVDALLREQPLHRDAHLLKGYLLGGQGDFMGAIGECTKVLDIDPMLAAAHLLLAMLLQQRGEANAALEHAKKALYLDPLLALGQFTLGSLREQSGDTAAARQAYQNTVDALKRDPQQGSRWPLPSELDGAALADLARARVGRLPLP